MGQGVDNCTADHRGKGFINLKLESASLGAGNIRAHLV